MADGVIKVDPDSTGKGVDTSELTVGGQTVQRVREVIADDTDPAALTKVTNAAPAGTEYGLVTRNIPSGVQPVSGPLTDAQLRAAAVPVSGPLTDAQLRAAAVPVSGLVDATGSIVVATGPLTDAQLRAAGVPVTGPLTDAQLRASAVPVSHGGLTDAQLRAAAVPVVGDIDHDVANTLKNVQVAGHASPCDVPPAVVSANGDRARIWVDRAGSVITRHRKLRETYTAVYRLAETAARLDQTFTQVANTTKQWATLHHTAAATKEVRLMKAMAYITASITVVLQGVLELRQITTAPASGNPAITPAPHRFGGAAAEAVCLYLPTTQATMVVDSPLGFIPIDYGIMGAVSTVNPLIQTAALSLYDSSQGDDEELPPTLPVGTLDGWAVILRTVGAPAVRMTVVLKFTEEIP